jgi:type II secretory pathway predicted ATPase ExeA
MIETLQSRYGFTVVPFTAAIPVTSLFGSAAHKEAVARLRWLISARGLGVITGEVGCGKTVAVRAAVSGLDPSRHTLIYLPNPQIGVRGIHGAVAAALGQVPRFHHATLIPQVEAALAAEADERNRHVILAIEESHLLTREQLEAVRMLTNSDLDSRSPLTILLIGQPTLRRRLRVGDMAALDQRVALRYHIPAPPLTPAEASGYIRAHLELEHPGFGGDSILPRCSGLGGRCLPRYRRLAEPRSDHFSAFVLSNICPASLSGCPLVAGFARQAPPRGWVSPRRATPGFAPRVPRPGRG